MQTAKQGNPCVLRVGVYLEIQGILKMDDVLPDEGRVIYKILPVLWFDVELLHGLECIPKEVSAC